MPALFDLVLHLDVALASLVATHGAWVYALLFAVVFCETGLVVTPFLPGDSLLFAAGALAGAASLRLSFLLALLFVAAVAGDTVNYVIGRKIGDAVVRREKLLGLSVRHEHILRAQRFYARHGGKAIVLARFIPIVRTFAPFVAGIGKMEYTRFVLYNMGGGALWVGLFVGGGYLFGNMPAVKERFSLVVVGIVIVSLVPLLGEAIRSAREKRNAKPERPAGT